MKCSECNYCWQDENDDYPRCHFEGWWAPPCEENDYVSDDDYEEEE